jgi:hypothetical protein
MRKLSTSHDLRGSRRLAYAPNELPALLGVSIASVRRYLAEGILPSVKLRGGRLLVPAAGLDRMLAGAGGAPDPEKPAA